MTLTLRTPLAKAHAKAIARAPALTRPAFCHVAALCLRDRHEGIGDVAAYLDSEEFYKLANMTLPLSPKSIETYINAVQELI